MVQAGACAIAVRARVRLGGKRNGAACGVRQTEKLSETNSSKIV